MAKPIRIAPKCHGFTYKPPLRKERRPKPTLERKEKPRRSGDAPGLVWF